jgi:4-amino-4-deoxy-L-arabinose transferase-like glycosyltransferase
MKGDAFWGFLSVEGLALVYQISWRFHEGFTHAVGAMCAVAAALWAMLRLIERQRAGDYALFGLIAGLGLLTVTPFAVYLGALIGAAAIQPVSRTALQRPALPISFAVALAVISPYLHWLAGTPEGIAAIVPEVTIGEPGYARAAITGLGRAFFEPVMYLAPLILLYPLFFPRYLATLWRTVRLRPEGGMRVDAEQLILHLTLLNLGALIVGALVFGIDRYPVHALMPLFLVTTIWLTAQARKAARGEREVRRFVLMALGVAAFAFAARCANMYVQQPVCQICRWGIPYAELADTIKSRGFDHGRLLVYDGDLAGNLRRFFPHAAIVLAGPRRYAPPERPAGEGDRTALVWETPRRPNANIARSFVAAVPGLQTEALERAETLRVPWRHHLWKPDGYRFSEWRVLILD